MNRKMKKALIEGKISDLKRLKKQQADILSSLDATSEEEEYNALMHDLELVRKMILETEKSIVEFMSYGKGDKIPILTTIIGSGSSLLALLGICYFEENKGLLRGNGAFQKLKIGK